MQNQKKPIQQKKPMQNFTAEKWADKIALFIDNFGFLSGFFWHWTIALPSPTSHLAMLHSKIILSDPNRRVKVVLIGFSLFWSRCRTWGNYRYLKKHLHICQGLSTLLVINPQQCSSVWVTRQAYKRWNIKFPFNLWCTKYAHLSCLRFQNDYYQSKPYSLLDILIPTIQILSHIW